MSDPHPARLNERDEKRDSKREDKGSFLQKLAEFIHPGPDSKDELIETLAEAEDNRIINSQSRFMLEGVIRMADMTAGDAMVAAPRMELLSIDAPIDELLNQVIETAHSRFPVYEDDKENIIGILMAKDLLKLQRAPELNIRALLRPAVFVPESKGLNELLRQFRGNRQHLAIVIDEFGRTAGLITIEDVLEEIVGEIEDEFDDADEEFVWLSEDKARARASLHIEDLADELKIEIEKSDYEDIDSVGGLMAQKLGRVPIAGSTISWEGWAITSERPQGRRRRISSVLVERLDEEIEDAE